LQLVPLAKQNPHDGREQAHDGREQAHDGREQAHDGKEQAHDGREQASSLQGVFSFLSCVLLQELGNVLLLELPCNPV